MDVGNDYQRLKRGRVLLLREHRGKQGCVLRAQPDAVYVRRLHTPRKNALAKRVFVTFLVFSSQTIFQIGPRS